MALRSTGKARGSGSSVTLPEPRSLSGALLVSSPHASGNSPASPLTLSRWQCAMAYGATTPSGGESNDIEEERGASRTFSVGCRFESDRRLLSQSLNTTATAPRLPALPRRHVGAFDPVTDPVSA
jgi:hypothetical protein